MGLLLTGVRDGLSKEMTFKLDLNNKKELTMMSWRQNIPSQLWLSDLLPQPQTPPPQPGPSLLPGLFASCWAERHKEHTRPCSSPSTL